MSRISSFSGMVVLVTACTTTTVAPLNLGPPRLPTCPEMVSVYTTRARVPGDYTELALLSSNDTDEPDVLESMREKAADIGASAILLLGLAQEASGEVDGKVASFGSDRSRALALAVHADSVRTREVCGARYLTDSEGRTWSAVHQRADGLSPPVIRFRTASGGDRYEATSMTLEQFRNLPAGELQTMFARARWIRTPEP